MRPLLALLLATLAVPARAADGHEHELVAAPGILWSARDRGLPDYHLTAAGTLLLGTRLGGHSLLVGATWDSFQPAPDAPGIVLAYRSPALVTWDLGSLVALGEVRSLFGKCGPDEMSRGPCRPSPVAAAGLGFAIPFDSALFVPFAEAGLAHYVQDNRHVDCTGCESPFAVLGVQLVVNGRDDGASVPIRWRIGAATDVLAGTFLPSAAGGRAASDRVVGPLARGFLELRRGPMRFGVGLVWSTGLRSEVVASAGPAARVAIELGRAESGAGADLVVSGSGVRPNLPGLPAVLARPIALGTCELRFFHEFGAFRIEGGTGLVALQDGLVPGLTSGVQANAWGPVLSLGIGAISGAP